MYLEFRLHSLLSHWQYWLFMRVCVSLWVVGGMIMHKNKQQVAAATYSGKRTHTWAKCTYENKFQRRKNRTIGRHGVH